MPWCPKCRYEYRPEITRCPNCRVALVTEQPEAPPRVAGWRIDEKTERYLAPIRGGFANGLQTAREAFRLTFSARKLLIVVGVLVTLYSIGQMVHTQVFLASLPNKNPSFPTERSSFTERWLARFKGQSSPQLILGDFSTPLGKPEGFSSSWMGALVSKNMAKYYSAVFQTNRQDWRPSFIMGIWGIWEGLVASLISSLVLVGLIGWLVALATETEPKRWRDYVKSHYIPIFVLSLCVSEGFQILISTWTVLNNVRITYGPNLLSIILQGLLGWLLPLAYLLLALAPFAIVGRNLGAWGGVKAGARILWQRGWTFLALLIGYRVVYEIIFMILGSLPTLSRTVMFTNLPLYSVTGWVLNMGLALLGLWLAMCFTMLVLPKREVAKDARTI